jgi:hypothetical protein
MVFVIAGSLEQSVAMHPLLHHDIIMTVEVKADMIRSGSDDGARPQRQ